MDHNTAMQFGGFVLFLCVMSYWMGHSTGYSKGYLRALDKFSGTGRE
jgi:hypothetical protein